MKQTISLVSLLMCAAMSQVWAASPVGVWRTIDDETGQAKSLIQISEVNGELQGKVIKLFRKPEEDQNPVCEKCDGSFKDQPVLGMTVLWGLKLEDGMYSGGHVLDPKKGKIYKARLKVSDDGKRVEMRGFVGFSLIGRTQIWLRETP